MFWSAVSTTSKCSAARRRSSPLPRLVHLISVTVRASCPFTRIASGRGNDSSSRTRTGNQKFFGDFERCDRLLAGHGGKEVEESFKRIASGRGVGQAPDGVPAANGHWGSCQNLRFACDD